MTAALQDIKARESECRAAASAADAEVRKARAEAAAIMEAAHAMRRDAEKLRENIRVQVRSKDDCGLDQRID
jgi:F0F1-type ATP synthase membrane subunit b/b'